MAAVTYISVKLLHFSSISSEHRCIRVGSFFHWHLIGSSEQYCRLVTGGLLIILKTQMRLFQDNLNSNLFHPPQKKSEFDVFSQTGHVAFYPTFSSLTWDLHNNSELARRRKSRRKQWLKQEVTAMFWSWIFSFSFHRPPEKLIIFYGK